MKLALVFLLLFPQSGADRAGEATARAWQRQAVGDFEGALAAFREAMMIGRESGDRAVEAASINWIGLVHQFLGDYNTADESYHRALAMAREIGNRDVEGIALFHIGWLHFMRHDFRAAVESYQESLVMRRAVGDRKGEGLTLMNLGMTYNSLGQYEKALQYESEALPLVQQYSQRTSEADVLDHMGIALTLLHRPEEAVERHTRALEIRRAFGGRWNFPFSLSHRAAAYEALGRTAEAAHDMREVIDIVESGRRNLSTKRFRASLFTGMVGHYEHAINVLMESHDEIEAFSMSERARARLTLDAVRDALARAESAEGQSVFAREDALLDELDRRRRDIEADTATLEKELHDVQEEIRRRYPTLAAARNADAFGADTIRAELLDDRTAVVEYFLGREKSFLFVLTRDTITAYPLPPRTGIEDSAVRLHALLSQGDRRTGQRELESALASLSSMIVKPVPPHIDRLIIVPDGALFYVPFAALQGEDPFQIVMAPSASTLVMLRRREAARPRAARNLAIFADPVFSADDLRVVGRASARPGPRAGLKPGLPDDLLRSAHDAGLKDLRRLPATREEANAIAALVRGGARKALDFDASRDSVLGEHLADYRVVHFATHALVNAQHPELSGIVLSLVDRRGGPVNGFLRVADLYRMDGAGDLVVLSACRTATGKELRGEGIVGLVSGFMNAGSPRVVASYWDVHDQPTAELMKRFYRAMYSGGMSPAAALQTAQRSMRAEPRWRSPAYWAAFALYGLW